MSVPKNVKDLAKYVDGYIVGGAVRDIFLGKEPHDYDITSPHDPETLTRMLEERGLVVIPKGVEFGTVSTLIPINGITDEVEITTYRTEEYSEEGGRKPVVAFGKDLKEDLLRRDFTFNAMALDPVSGEIIDMFGGVNDLNSKKIKYVGNTKDRIREDPLRMVRACRFAARYGATIDAEDKEIMKSMSDELDRVSKERLAMEVVKTTNKMAPFLDCLMETNIADKLFGENIFKSREIKHDHRYTHYGETNIKHTTDVLACMDKNPKNNNNLALKLAGVLHDIAKPDKVQYRDNGKISFIGHDVEGYHQCKKILRDLKFDNKTIKKTCFIVRNHMFPGEITKKTLGKKIVDMKLHNSGIKEDWLDDLFELQRCDSDGVERTGLINNAKRAFRVERPQVDNILDYEPNMRSGVVRDKWIKKTREALK